MKKKVDLLLIFKPELRAAIALGLFVTLLIALITTVYFFLAQPELPIFYSLPESSGILQAKIFLFILPAISLLISLITMVMIFVLGKIDSSLLKLYTWASVSSQIILFMSTIRIIYITA